MRLSTLPAAGSLDLRAELGAGDRSGSAKAKIMCQNIKRGPGETLALSATSGDSERQLKNSVKCLKQIKS